MSELWLPPEEVEELTARKKWAAQCRQLARMGIPFKPNAVGRPLVERAVVLSSPAPAKPKVRKGPDWSTLHGKAA